MKTINVILAIWAFSILPIFAGGMPVIDTVSIANQRIAAQRAYIEQVLQGLEQMEQTLKMADEIARIDSYLERFGDPGAIRNLEGLEELQRQLESMPVLRTSELKKEDIQPDEVFRPMSSKINPGLEKDIIVDGKVVAVHDDAIYAPEVAERRAHVAYQETWASVSQRREKLRAAIAATTKQIQQASTASEVQKLGLVLSGLQSELQATDRELEFAANDVQAQLLANATEKEILRKATVERERETLRVSTKKDAELYRLYTTPIRFESP